VAVIHILFAFVIAHVYLLSTGHSFREHVKPMLTGYDEVDLSEAEEAFLEKSPAARLK